MASSTKGAVAIPRPARLVPPFSTQARQKNTAVKPLSSSAGLAIAKNKANSPQVKATAKRAQRSSRFRAEYDHGSLPIELEQTNSGPRLVWKKPLSTVDVASILPILFDGLPETAHPYALLAERAVEDVLKQPSAQPAVLNALPYLVQPLRRALQGHEPSRIRAAAKVLQLMAGGVQGCGEALVPYYRQLLTGFGRFVNRNVNLGDDIEFGRSDGENLSDVAEKTLRLLEATGGKNAFINIRYLIPTYTSGYGAK